MSYINWDESYEIGIPEIDRQHRQLIDNFNDFYKHLSNEELGDNLRELLQKMMDYTDYHFKEEEKYMASINYKYIDDQREMHNQIREKMASYKKLADEGKLTVSMPVTNEIKKWIKEHIQIEDKKIAQSS
ncbi:MAG: hemerythrin family protein [Spirochaetales bacterium]|nr:hemerythrin family protein [Spirochaetales bacterium]